MLKEFLSSIGIGSLKVDTVVDNPTLTPASELSGEVLIEGGVSEQEVNKIVLTICIREEDYRKDSDFSYHEKELHSYEIKGTEIVKSDEVKRIPFKFTLSKDHPLTDKGVETFLRTMVDIPEAIDPVAEDSITVVKSVSS
ncbi:MAG: sporulation protein [Bacillota bacterium]